MHRDGEIIIDNLFAPTFLKWYSVALCLTFSISFIMIRTLLLYLAFSFGIGLAQAQTQDSFTAHYGTPEFTQSKYHHLEKAVNYSVKASLHLLLGKGKAQKGVDANARFFTQVDPDSVYDNTYKVYSAALSGLRVEYVTYNLADRLTITLNGKVFEANCIDGGCDVFLKNLAHFYKQTPDGEELRLKVTKDFPLTAKDKTELWLRANSELVFAVNEKAN